ncbi:MAG: MATE family efflux transporter [Bacteroidales bacterium]
MSLMKKTLQLNLPHYSAIAKLAFPIIVGQLGLIVVGLSDNIMVGHYGTDELAAASFVNSIFNLATLFGLGFSYGLTPIIGSLIGKKEYLKSGIALRNSLVANGLFGIILTFCMMLVYLNVEKMQQPTELLPLIRPYFLLQTAGLIIIMIFNAFKQFTDGIGDAYQSMKVMLVCNVVNIIGNYLLIYGNWGFPELGLNGAGISTLVSRILLPVLMGITFFFAPKFREFRKGFLNSKADLPAIKRLAKDGVPVAFQIGLEASAFNLSAIMIGWVGTTALAAHQVMMGLTTLGYLIYYGVGSAITILSSRYIGQSQGQEAIRVSHCGAHLILAWCAVLIPILAIFRNHIGSIFTSSEEVNALVALLVFPTIIYQIADGIQIGYANALRGIGDMKAMPYISFLSFFMICLPASYFFGIYLNMGAVGIWMGFPIGLTVAATLFFIRFKSRTAKIDQLIPLQAE